MIKKEVKKTTTSIRLQNPYMDETIKVEEDYKYILSMLKWIEQGDVNYLYLQQIAPEKG